MVLPDDVLAVVFRRLAPRSLAASRCVCKAWRDVIDARRLLRPDLLPHAVRGIFLEYTHLDYPVFLARPSAGPAVDGKLGFLLESARASFLTLLDHCNGLSLYRDKHGLLVLNLATQRWARLPPPPFMGVIMEHIARLVFDPIESPHYEVFLVPDHPDREEEVNKCRQAMNTPSSSIVSGQTLIPSVAEDTEEPGESVQRGLADWPSSTCVFSVFSSRTGRWEERVYAREGKAMGTIAEMREYGFFWRGYSVCCRDTLYVQCSGGIFMTRISLSNDKYQVIKMPSGIDWMECSEIYLGKSVKGVSCASFRDWYHLQIWVLDESCDQIEWVSKHQIDVVPILHALNYDEQNETEGPWILQDVNNAEDDNNEAENKFEWDSDNDGVINIEYGAAQHCHGHFTFLGFHPYKDVVFLNVSLSRAVAYHLDSSMVQDLGNLCPKGYRDIAGSFADILMSFPFTPCMMTIVPENNLEGHDQE
ncbi:hypothetical protein EJB05_54888, partial [Eragrostis curvula]